jgi:DNA (cytosine-5)-methyltransferase 3A
MNILSLFDGISCGQVALNRAGISYDNYYASEIDKFAIQIADKNYPHIKRLGNVLDVKHTDLPHIDLLIGGSPCKTVSRAGNGKGFDGESGLFWEFLRILNETKPKYFLLENVKMKKEWMNIITENLGVQPIHINSNLLSAQNRPRTYWTNIPGVTLPEDRKIYLSDIIPNNPVCFTERRTEEAKQIRRENRKNGIDFSPRRMKEIVARTDGKSNCLTATFSSKEHMVKTDIDDYMRKLTPNEWELLQTLPLNYTDGVSDNQRYKMIGNGWTVDVIAHILKNIK